MWWVVAGAYCLAWCAGFLAFWAPGGIGVRELVFVTAMQVILPQRVRDEIGNEAPSPRCSCFWGSCCGCGPWWAR